MKIPLRHSLLAEALGTAVLLAFGTSAAVVNEQTHALGHGGVAAAFGLVVLVLIQSLGAVSGAHVNPAVTVAFWAAGRFPGARVLPYVGAQLLGALAGSGLVKLLATEGSTLGATLPAHGSTTGDGARTGTVGTGPPATTVTEPSTRRTWRTAGTSTTSPRAVSMITGVR